VEILLVEDNDDDIVIIRETLEESHLLNLLKVVRDGEEAMAYLRREAPFEEATEPGLVLLDINMPRKNGFEVLDEIKGDPGLRHIPVVMLTVSDRDEDVLRSYQAGACSYVRKPVDFERLRAVVRGFELYWTLVSELPRGRR
jgi:CheY-like chemotaxis protein